MDMSGQQYIMLESFFPYWQGITKSFDFLVFFSIYITSDCVTLLLSSVYSTDNFVFHWQLCIPLTTLYCTDNIVLHWQHCKVKMFQVYQKCQRNCTVPSIYKFVCLWRGITNRKKKLIGLTVRVALPLLGCADMMYDIALSDKSTLILGCPGVGKTTLLRELARSLSDTEGKKVVVIDTCNEVRD